MVQYATTSLKDYKHDAGIIILEANQQGILHLNNYGNIFLNKFPRTYRDILIKITKEDLHVGDIHFFSEDKYRIAVMVTAFKVIGAYKDSEELYFRNLTTCFKKLLDMMSTTPKHFILPILGGRFFPRMHGTMVQNLQNTMHNWTVVKGKEV